MRKVDLKNLLCLFFVCVCVWGVESLQLELEWEITVVHFHAKGTIPFLSRESQSGKHQISNCAGVAKESNEKMVACDSGCFEQV